MAVLAVLGIVAGAAASLVMIVMLLAGGANAKPETITQIKWLMAATALVGLLAVIGAIWTFTQGKHGLSGALGVAPLVYVIVLTIVLVKLEW